MKYPQRQGEKIPETGKREKGDKTKQGTKWETHEAENLCTTEIKRRDRRAEEKKRKPQTASFIQNLFDSGGRLALAVPPGGDETGNTNETKQKQQQIHTTRQQARKQAVKTK